MSASAPDRVWLIRGRVGAVPSALCFALFAIGAAAAPSRVPLGWTVTSDPKGRCTYAVPADWRVENQEHANAFASSPDGSVTVWQNWVAAPDWSLYVSSLRVALKPTLIREASAYRFWVEYAAGWPGTHHFIAVPSAGGACATEIDVNGRGGPPIQMDVDRVMLSISAID